MPGKITLPMMKVWPPPLSPLYSILFINTGGGGGGGRRKEDDELEGAVVVAGARVPVV